MKATLCVLLFALAVGVTAKADPVGSWSGSIDYTVDEGDYHSNDSWSCEFAMTRTSKYLFVYDNDWCTYMSPRYEIRGGELWEDGEQVGTISETEIHIGYGKGVTYRMDMNVQEDGSLKIHETMSKPKRCGHTFADMTEGTFEVDSRKISHNKKSTVKHKTERLK